MATDYEQIFIDAQEDATSLSQFISESPDFIVQRRLADPINTLEFYIDEATGLIFENGGLPATPYKTKALMEASAQVDGEYAQVTDDTVNNGLYYKETGVWVKSEYDPLTKAKAYTDIVKTDTLALAATDAQNKASAAQAEAALLLDSRVYVDDISEDLEQKTDVEGRIYSRHAADGELYLTNMSGKSVQESLASIPKYLPTSESDILNIEDEEDKIIAVVDKNAGLLLAGINGSVQDNINRIAPRITNARRDKKWFFTDATQSYLYNVYASGMGHAPVPLSLLPSNYTVPNTVVEDLKLIPPTGRLTIDTPYYQDDWVVHPFIFEAVGTIRGYRYIMAINPYKFESHENPVIYGSNDLDNFEMLTGFDQPLDTPPEGGFLSDSGFTYDPASGELICYWRITRRPEDGNIYTSYWCKRTKDLLNWTDKEMFFEELENGVDGLTSPAILFDPATDLWHLWNIKQAGIVVHRTSPSLFGDWSEPTQINTGTTIPWHIEVRWVGGKMVMLINKRDPDSNYFLGISADGINWTFSSTPMLNVQLPALYKATFLPQFDIDDNFYLEFLYTTNHNDDPDLKRRLYHTKTNSVTI